MKNSGWLFVFGVLVGAWAIKLKEQLPFAIRVMSDIREATSGRWLEATVDDALNVFEDDDEDD